MKKLKVSIADKVSAELPQHSGITPLAVLRTILCASPTAEQIEAALAANGLKIVSVKTSPVRPSPLPSPLGMSAASYDQKWKNRSTFSVEEAGCEILGLSKCSAYAAAKSGSLPTIRIGRRLVVPRLALERMMEASE